MKKLIALTLLITSFNLGFSQKKVPYLTGRVNDEAGVLSSETRQSLEQLLKAHEDSTTNQIAVLIINSLEGEVLEEYSLKVAETWALGQKGKDNGVLLLVALNDRKMRIEVGYGLEGSLTDALSSRIIRNEIAPSFRQNDYDAGVTNGVKAIVSAIGGSYMSISGDEEYVSFEDEFPWYLRLFIGFVFLIIIGTFTYFALMSTGCSSWFLFLFLIPFYGTFPFILFGIIPGFILITVYIVGFLSFKLFYIQTKSGKQWFKTASKKFATSSSGSSGWSSSGGGFSGGGGSFGGGGSSGSW